MLQVSWCWNRRHYSKWLIKASQKMHTEGYLGNNTMKKSENSIQKDLPVLMSLNLERQWIDAFELWCWRRLLRVLWTARRSNQSIRKEINPEYSLEGLVLKLKLQYFGHLMWRTDLLEKTRCRGRLRAGGGGGNRGWDGWMASLTQWA